MAQPNVDNVVDCLQENPEAADQESIAHKKRAHDEQLDQHEEPELFVKLHRQTQIMQTCLLYPSSVPDKCLKLTHSGTKITLSKDKIVIKSG